VPTLPRSESSLVRTDFTSDEDWRQACAQAQQENGDGFRAHIEPVSDPGFDRASWIQVTAAVPADSQPPCCSSPTARPSPHPEHPVLVVDLLNGRPPFRCLPAQLWSVENNLNIANMD
jgi:hypothetical protein